MYAPAVASLLHLRLCVSALAPLSVVSSLASLSNAAAMSAAAIAVCWLAAALRCAAQASLASQLGPPPPLATSAAPTPIEGSSLRPGQPVPKCAARVSPAGLIDAASFYLMAIVKSTILLMLLRDCVATKREDARRWSVLSVRIGSSTQEASSHRPARPARHRPRGARRPARARESASGAVSCFFRYLGRRREAASESTARLIAADQREQRRAASILRGQPAVRLAQQQPVQALIECTLHE